VSLISVGNLAASLDKPGLKLLDARFDLADARCGRQLYQDAHIAGAQYIDLDKDMSGQKSDPCQGRHPLPSASHWQAVLERLGMQADDRVVIYDQSLSAMAAARAWFLFILAGHENVSVLDGGMDAWLAAGLPVTADEPRQAVSHYPLQFNTNRLIDAITLKRQLSDNPLLALLDARATERFRGDVEPLDIKAGHIPGALNRPFTDNLQDGVFKEPAQLHAEFYRILGNRTDIVLSCGSGVTACHNALALSHAGIDGWRLFAPSWSGWIADACNPVAVGD
jgi:thiosulfate/3-mercaptopyruvate sulfurtransferase